MCVLCGKLLQSCLTLWMHGLYPSRLPCQKDSPGTNIGVGCHALLQVIFSIQRLKLCLLSLLYWQVSSLLESPEVKVKAIQSCLSLCEPMDCSPWNSPGQNTGVGSLSLLQCIFPIQESNQGLLHCRGILYQLSYILMLYLFIFLVKSLGILPGIK